MSLAAAVAVLGAYAQVTSPEPAATPAQLEIGPPAPVTPAPVVPSAPAPADLSPAAADVINLAESGVTDDVVLAYIRNSKSTFNLTADHVVYLKDLGFSPEVLSAMITHDTDLQAQGPVQYSAPTNTAPVAPPPAEPIQEPLPVAEQPAPLYVEPPADVGYFYNDLAPYGSWVVLDGYGWCWQPRAVVVNHGWRPYCDGGRWVYSDCGWYWQSDYSWGWAPFHYGRWTMHNRCGWVWMPDRVWGPAWVTWRVGGDYCGWAPLPPRTHYDGHYGWRHNGVHVGVNVDFGLHANHFTFVGMKGVTDRNLRRHQLSSTQVKNVWNQTTVINNYGDNNTTVVNQGVPVDRVAAATRQPVRRAAVRDVSADTATRSRWQTPERNAAGDNVVYRTQLRNRPTPTKVAAQKVDDSNPVIQHPTITSSRWQQGTRVATGTAGTTGRSSAASISGRTAQGTSWQTPQRSTVSNGSRPATTPTTRSTGQSTATAPAVSPLPRTSPPNNSTTGGTVVNPRTWQTPSRNNAVTTPSSRADSRSATVPSTSVAPSASREEKPASSTLPQPTRWDTPARRVQATPNVVRTVPQQNNPQVYYPKTQSQNSSAPAAPRANSGWSTPSRPAAAPARTAPAPTSSQPSVRSAPPAASRPAPQANAQSTGRWQTPSRSANSSNNGNSSSTPRQ